MAERKVFRYVVPVDDQAHQFALYGNPLAVASMGVAVEFWAEHAAGEDIHTEVRSFRVFGTGHPIPTDARWRGTCQRHLGLVWHLYEVTP